MRQYGLTDITLPEGRNAMSEDRFIEIEIKLSRQEDLLDTLNDIVVQQQRKIQQLDALCTALAQRLQQTGQATDALPPADEKPPHY